MADTMFPGLTTVLKALRSSTPQPSSTSSLHSLPSPTPYRARMSLPLTPPPTPVKSLRRKYKKAPTPTTTTTFAAPPTATTANTTFKTYAIDPLHVPSKQLIPAPRAGRTAALQFLFELHRQAHFSANELESGRPVSFVSPDKRLSPRSAGFKVDCDVRAYRTDLERLRLDLEGFLEEEEDWWARTILEDVEVALVLLEGFSTGREEMAEERKDAYGRPEIEQRYLEVLRLLVGGGSGSGGGNVKMK